MKKWILPRGCGKTTMLLTESIRTGAVIVTFRDPQYILDLAEYLGIDENKFPKPIRFQKFLDSNFRRQKHNEKYLIDELDLCLEQLDVVGYSNTPTFLMDRHEEENEEIPVEYSIFIDKVNKIFNS